MISVIIPTYNSEKYICEAIDSVFNQSYSDYEIIVIDDGSTDNTRTIIQNKYNSIRYHYVENNGVATARNLGIQMARGEFIAFLDADDKWLPTKLEKQITCFQNNDKLGMVFTENSFFNDLCNMQGQVSKRESLMQGDIVRNIFLKSYVATPTVMVRKSVFKAVGLFEEELVVAEDDNMWMRIGMKYSIELIDETLAQCRITDGSLSRKKHNIYHGVRNHMQVLKSKYPDIHQRLGESAIKMKYAELLFSEGYCSFAHYNFKDARSNFIKSYLYCPFKLKPLCYALSTFLPLWVIEKVKYVKRNFENRVGHD